jgi:hypothetical protein
MEQHLYSFSKQFLIILNLTFKTMNTGLFLVTVAIVAAFGIAAIVGSVTITTPVVAQNMTG